MGGRGAASSAAYGTEHITLLSYENIKFVKKTKGSQKRPMESRISKRIYVSLNSQNKLQTIAFMDGEGKRYKTIDLSHKHFDKEKIGQGHVHIGMNHAEKGRRLRLSAKEKRMVKTVKRLYWRYLNGSK